MLYPLPGAPLQCGPSKVQGATTVRFLESALLRRSAVKSTAAFLTGDLPHHAWEPP